MFQPLPRPSFALALLTTFALAGCCRPTCYDPCGCEPCGTSYPMACGPTGGCGIGCCPTAGRYTPCGPGGGCGPQCCVARPTQPHIEIVDDCCQPRRGWLSRLFFRRRNDCYCEPCCPPPCGQSGCCPTNGCCPNDAGPRCERPARGCACEPGGYLTTQGYNPWKDARCVVSAADDCADRALHQLEDRCDVCRDFENGFRKAYRDVALGGDGRVPAVPPRKFWQAACRTEEGHGRARAWFHGYECGAEHAQNDGLQPYRRLATPHDLGPGYERIPRGSVPADARPVQLPRPCNQRVEYVRPNRFDRETRTGLFERGGDPGFVVPATEGSIERGSTDYLATGLIPPRVGPDNGVPSPPVGGLGEASPEDDHPSSPPIWPH